MSSDWGRESCKSRVRERKSRTPRTVKSSSAQIQRLRTQMRHSEHTQNQEAITSRAIGQLRGINFRTQGRDIMCQHNEKHNWVKNFRVKDF
eukprot:5657796-Amphidinium_carterae.1